MGEGIGHEGEGHDVGMIRFEEINELLLGHIAHKVEELAVVAAPPQVGDERGDPHMEGTHDLVAGIDVHKATFMLGLPPAHNKFKGNAAE